MSHTIKRIYVQNTAAQLANAVKNRIRAVILTSMLAVALTFGLSFYFALVSNTAAVARQVPELEAAVSKLKSLLIFNTFVFVLIIIASFYVLSLLITSRLFRPLGNVQEGLLAITKGTLPRKIDIASDSPFSNIEATLKEVIDILQEKESREIEKLSQYIAKADISEGELKASISKVLKEKNAFLGLDSGKASDTEPAVSNKEAEAADESIFMQPVE